MNLMFKELSLKAGLACSDLPNTPGRVMIAIDRTTGERIDPTLALNVFADLLIEQCIKCIEDEAKDAFVNHSYMGDDVPSSMHSLNIKKKFGIIK